MTSNNADAAPRMLEGIRVIDLTSVVFGPYATLTLAELGADVIKVESAAGDNFRAAGRPRETPGMGACHLNLNKGKRSVVLDLKSEPGRAKLRELLLTADVFVHNVRDKAIRRLGFGYEDVQALKPDTIYVHCVGFGSKGPYRDRPAYDDVIQAGSGAATLLPRVDGNASPRYIPSLIADKVAGLHGAYAILAAIIHRLRTGEGQFVEVPMFEAFTHFMMLEHLFGNTFEPPLYPAGYPRQLDPLRQPFATADGYVCIVAYTDDAIVRVIKMLGADELLADPRFASPADRRRSVSQFYEELAARTPAQSSAYWVDLCEAADIPALSVRDLSDVQNDPHLREVGFFQLENHPTEGTYRKMQAPVAFGAARYDVRPAPSIGENNSDFFP